MSGSAADDAASKSSGSARSGRSSEFSHDPTGHTIADAASVAEADGRTYNAYRQDRYYLPNDGAEQDRLDLQHHMWRLLLDGRLGDAPVPVSQPIDVLDIGTGTGIWAIQFAEKHPSSRVIGTDISLIQPDFVPANCTFYREDAEEDPWVFDGLFDYIHLRAICTCFNDARRMVKRLYDHLRPGGWVEYQDFTFEMIGADEASNAAIQRNPTSFAKVLQRTADGCMVLAHRDARVTVNYKKWMLDSGFVDVVDKPVFFPLNPWPLDPKDREIGKYTRQDAHDGTESVRKLLVASGIPEDGVDEWIQGVHRDIDDTSVHAYVEWRIIYGRKPFEYESPLSVDGGSTPDGETGKRS